MPTKNVYYFSGLPLTVEDFPVALKPDKFVWFRDLRILSFLDQWKEQIWLPNLVQKVRF